MQRNNPKSKFEALPLKERKKLHERYTKIKALAEHAGGDATEKASAFVQLGRLEREYPGIESYTPKQPSYERSPAGGMMREWMERRVHAPDQGVTPRVKVEKQRQAETFPWADIMPEWTLITAGVFLGIRKGGLVDVYMNNTYKMTSPSLRAVVMYLVQLIQGQQDSRAGAWKVYNVFVGRDDPPELDAQTLGELALNVGLLETSKQMGIVGDVHAPGLGQVQRMDEDDFEPVDEFLDDI
jgi:hypothetical protein